MGAEDVEKDFQISPGARRSALRRLDSRKDSRREMSLAGKLMAVLPDRSSAPLLSLDGACNAKSYSHTNTINKDVIPKTCCAALIHMTGMEEKRMS